MRVHKNASQKLKKRKKKNGETATIVINLKQGGGEKGKEGSLVLTLCFELPWHLLPKSPEDGEEFLR